MIKPRKVRAAGYVVYMGEVKNACIILVEKRQGNKTLGRPRLRLNDSIEIDHKHSMGVKTGFISLRIGIGSGLL